MIEKLNTHYSFTAEPSVYDEEALTALQLAGRTAAKVNEIVDDQNLLRHETGVALDDTTKQMVDYMRETDELLEKYGVETIPETVTREVQSYIDEGRFNEALTIYNNALNARLDAVISSLNIGGGEYPAELADLRVDVNSNKWLSAGSAVRSQINNIYDDLEDITTRGFGSSLIGEPTVFNMYTVNHSGEKVEGFGKSINISVNAGERYLISAYYGYEIPAVVFLDHDGNLVDAKFSNLYGYSEIRHGIVAVPEGARSMVVNSAGNKPSVEIDIIPFGRLTLKPNELIQYINSKIHAFESVQYVYRGVDDVNPEDIYTNVYESCVIGVNETGYWGVKPLVNPNPLYKVYQIPVMGGLKIRFKTSANFDNMHYYFYKSSTLEIITSETVAGDSIINKEWEIEVPYGCDSLFVATYDHTPNFSMAMGFDLPPKWSHLKWLCVGDSITEKNERTSKNYHDYIHEKTGISVVNLGVSGSGLMPSDTSIPNYLTKVITNPDKTQDVITIMLSGNDALNATKSLGDVDDTGTETWCGSLNNMLNIIENVYADAVIGIITSPPWANHMPYQNTIFKQMAVKAKEICKRRSIAFLDLFQCSNLNPNNNLHKTKYYSKDNGNGVHPNEAGHQILASPIYAFLDSLIGMK